MKDPNIKATLETGFKSLEELAEAVRKYWSIVYPTLTGHEVGTLFKKHPLCALVLTFNVQDVKFIAEGIVVPAKPN